MNKEHLDGLIRHINNVRENCELLGNRLFSNNQEDLGLELIANSFIHDNSKFSGIEWLYLNQETKDSNKQLFDMAIKQHTTTNNHHPEAWSSIFDMPQVYLAEFVCDCKARSEEFGSDINEWMRKRATEKFGFSRKSRVYRDIMRYLGMLLEQWS